MEILMILAGIAAIVIIFDAIACIVVIKKEKEGAEHRE